MNIANVHEMVLVEDNPDDEKISLRGIDKAGIHVNVTVKRDGEAALEHLLDDDQPAPKLILLDYKLPKYDGLQVLRLLRSSLKLRNVPVVMLSGSHNEGLLDECYASGANSCVAKAADPSLFMEEISYVTRYWLSVNLGGGCGTDELPIQRDIRSIRKRRSDGEQLPAGNYLE